MGREIRYQQRPTYLRDIIWRQGYIDPLSLFRILAWKSAKGLASVTLNEPGRIEEVTRQALVLLEPYRDVEQPQRDESFWAATHDALVGSDGKSSLFALDGIRVPTGSAVLNILNPFVWPIIDRWAYVALFGVTPKQAVGKIGWFNNYRAYVEALARLLSNYPGKNIHDLDQMAMNAGMQGQDFPATG